MRTNHVAAAVGLLCLAFASAPPGAGEPAIVGSWRLVSEEEHAPDGTVTAIWGSSPEGRLMYDAGGRMAVQVMDPRRRRFASEDRLGGTADEVRQAFEGYVAYFGSYRMDAEAGVVIHHVDGSLSSEHDRERAAPPFRAFRQPSDTDDAPDPPRRSTLYVRARLGARRLRSAAGRCELALPGTSGSPP